MYALHLTEQPKSLTTAIYCGLQRRIDNSLKISYQKKDSENNQLTLKKKIRKTSEGRIQQVKNKNEGRTQTRLYNAWSDKMTS